MIRKSGMWALVAALLLSGALVGVSQGRSPGIAEPQELMVFSGEVLEEAHRGLVNQLRESAVDADGERVGTIRWTCLQGSDYICTVLYKLDGRGSVVSSGLFRGFQGESFAVTGGTGGFSNVRGVVTYTVEADEFVHTLRLTP